MQPVHVKRYSDTSHGYQGTIEPEDGTWILFVPKLGKPQLWERASHVPEDGQTVSTYTPTE